MMNAYEKYPNQKQQEARDLAIMAALSVMTDTSPLKYKPLIPDEAALGRAWESFERAAQFLKKKEAERLAAEAAYWNSPEGKARREEIVKRFEEMK